MQAWPLRIPVRARQGSHPGMRPERHVVAVEVLTVAGQIGRGLAFPERDAAVSLAARLVSLPPSLVGFDRGAGPAGDPALDSLPTEGRAALDMAAWDARARINGVPLFSLLGGDGRSVPVYASTGAGAPLRVIAAAEALASAGFSAVEVALGGSTLEEDVRLLDSVAKAVGPEVALMVDYRQSLSRAEAAERLQGLDGAGLVWIKDPIRGDDFLGQRRLAAGIATPLQGGSRQRSGADVRATLDIVGARALTLDIQRIGGVSAWLRMAFLAAARKASVSTHHLPEIGAHVLAASQYPGWLRWSDRASSVLVDTPPVVAGRASPSRRPGNGLEWDRRRLDRYRM